MDFVMSFSITSFSCITSHSCVRTRVKREKQGSRHVYIVFLSCIQPNENYSDPHFTVDCKLETREELNFLLLFYFHIRMLKDVGNKTYMQLAYTYYYLPTLVLRFIVFSSV